MQWLTNLPLGDKPALQIAVLAGIVIVAITALVIAYRALFGHRLRFAGGGKARQPRLGLVDAFSLDGQRQLVIVRRDNVEHLLMIGGPNDIVVESQIVRALPQALPRDQAPPREKDVAAPSAPSPKAPIAVAPVPPAIKPPPAAVIPPAPPPIAAAAIPPARPVAPPAPIVMPMPVRAAVRPEPAAAIQAKGPPPASPQSPLPAAASLPAKAPPAPEPAEIRAAPRPSVLPLRPSVPAPKPSPLPPPIVMSSGPSNPPAPPRPVVMPAPPAFAPRPTSASPQAAGGAKSDPFAGLDSLEAEMARLLGRDP